MDPQHLARLDDDKSVRRISTGTAGGFATTGSPEGHEVPVSAPVHPLDATGARPARSPRTVLRRTFRGGATVVLRPDGRSDGWPLPVQDDGAVHAGTMSDARPVLDVEAGRAVRHRRPSIRTRRPALYLAAAVIGAAGLAVTAGGNPSQAAQADEPASVAQELGLGQATQSALSTDEATIRLQQQIASRAEREDAQAAAAQAQSDADRAATDAAAAAAAQAARPQVVLPVQGARLTSGFGSRWGTLHAGVDFAAPLGTPEYAAMDGVVLRAGAASGFGLAVYIQHQNGDVTIYGHMQQILVAEGQTVKAGDTIALLGNRGESTGPHLHFEVHLGGIDGEKVDPLPWLRERGVQV
jgi:murein DD-endopeptidase MepM/ murein hydrolase activator NlpD